MDECEKRRLTREEINFIRRSIKKTSKLLTNLEDIAQIHFEKGGNKADYDTIIENCQELLIDEKLRLQGLMRKGGIWQSDEVL